MYQNFISYLYEAQHVSGDTPPIIRSLKLHWQTLVLHTWRVVARVVAGRCPTTLQSNNNVKHFTGRPTVYIADDSIKFCNSARTQRECILAFPLRHSLRERVSNSRYTQNAYTFIDEKVFQEFRIDFHCLLLSNYVTERSLVFKFSVQGYSKTCLKRTLY